MNPSERLDHRQPGPRFSATDPPPLRSLAWPSKPARRPLPGLTGAACPHPLATGWGQASLPVNPSRPGGRGAGRSPPGGLVTGEYGAGSWLCKHHVRSGCWITAPSPWNSGKRDVCLNLLASCTPRLVLCAVMTCSTASVTLKASPRRQTSPKESRWWSLTISSRTRKDAAMCTDFQLSENSSLTEGVADWV